MTTNTFCFRGNILDVKDPKYGDIVYGPDGEILMYEDKNSWITICPVESLEEPKEEPKPAKITYPTNCKNCGAVMKSCTCKYCGTTYTGYEEPKRIDEPKYDDKLITAAALSLAKQNNDPLYDELVDSYRKKRYFMNCLKYDYDVIKGDKNET